MEVEFPPDEGNERQGYVAGAGAGTRMGQGWGLGRGGSPYSQLL